MDRSPSQIASRNGPMLECLCVSNDENPCLFCLGRHLLSWRRHLGTLVANKASSMLSEETRQKLATKLNQLIDIPILGEDQEQVLAEKVIDICLDKFDYSDDEIEEMKRNLKTKMVEKLNAKVDIPFANERLEARVLGKIADFILKDKFDSAAEEDEDDE